jgi:hypothetical protein
LLTSALLLSLRPRFGHLLVHDCSISLERSLVQMYFLALGVTDSWILAAIAYDHYVAILHNLLCHKNVPAWPW